MLFFGLLEFEPSFKSRLLFNLSFLWNQLVGEPGHLRIQRWLIVQPLLSVEALSNFKFRFNLSELLPWPFKIETFILFQLIYFQFVFGYLAVVLRLSLSHLVLNSICSLVRGSADLKQIHDTSMSELFQLVNGRWLYRIRARQLPCDSLL